MNSWRNGTVSLATVSLVWIGRGSSAVIALAIWPTAEAIAQSSPVSSVEEVVVTGSYVRRNNLESPSPLTVVTAEALKAQGLADSGQLFAQLPINTGSEFNSGLARGGATAGTASVNLRGVGVSSTLILLDGGRQVKFAGLAADNTQSFVDVNALVPQIAIERVEIAKDGGSAIYGSDAIAGVVNFITRKQFDGLELSGELRRTTDWGDQRDIAVSGLAGVSSERGNIVVAASYLDRTNLNGLDRYNLEKGKALSANGQPGTYSIPLRDAAGRLRFNATGAQVLARRPDPLCGQPGIGGAISGTSCLLEFGLARDIIAAEKRYDLFANVGYDITDNLKARAQFGYHDGRVSRFGVPSTGILKSVAIPGFNPGNPFRAVNSVGQPLFAVRDPTNPGRPLLDAAGNAVLTANPTDPSSGIAFNENVLGSIRVLGPGDFPPQGGDPSCCAQVATSANQVYRAAFDLDGSLPFAWSWNAHAVYAENRLSDAGGETNPLELDRALRGQGGPQDNLFYNPFATGARNSALTQIGPARPGDPTYNTLEVIDSILLSTKVFRRSVLEDYRFVATGPLFRLPWSGEVQMAAGVERRREHIEQTADDNLRTGNVGNGGAQPDFSGDQKVTGIFAELVVPLLKDSPLGDAEAQLAIRRESYSEGFKTTDPKVALRWQPWRAVALRASYGTAFTAPTIFQENGRVVTTRNVRDPVDGTTSFRGVVTTGNPGLKPETATSINLGATFEVLDRLSIDIDHWSLDYKGKISVQSVVPLIAANPFGPQIQRDPNTGKITQINVLFFNASRVKTQGTDVTLLYRLGETDFGAFEFGGAVSHIDKYEIQSQPGTASFEAKGSRNFNNIGAPTPVWRGNVFAHWRMGGQSASLYGRYIDGLKDDEAGNAKVKSHFTWDAQYQLAFATPTLDESKTTLTVGATNILGQSIPEIRGSDAFIGELYDPRERVVYARVQFSF